MKKLIFIAALFLASFAADAQCIKFKVSGANLISQAWNATGDSIVFGYSVTIYVEKIGAGRFEKTDNASFVLVATEVCSKPCLEALILQKAEGYKNQYYPNIQ